jgi:hypothetical protein
MYGILSHSPAFPFNDNSKELLEFQKLFQGLKDTQKICVMNLFKEILRLIGEKND